jgi:hypothetical protein
MHTVVETEVFIRAASEIWTDAERISFINWLASNPEAGDVVPVVAAKCVGAAPAWANAVARG